VVKLGHGLLRNSSAGVRMYRTPAGVLAFLGLGALVLGVGELGYPQAGVPGVEGLELLGCELPVVEDEDAGGDHRGPHVFGSFGGLGDVAGGDDFSAQLPLLFALVPGLGGVELQAHGGGEHAGGQVFGVVAGLLVIDAVGVVFAEVAELGGIGGHGHADAGGHHAAVVVGGLSRHYAEGYLAVMQFLEALALGDDLAPGGHDRADGNHVQ